MSYRTQLRGGRKTHIISFVTNVVPFLIKALSSMLIDGLRGRRQLTKKDG
jgi:hypothetical protein